MTDQELRQYGKNNIPHFRGVFMRNALPRKPYKKECGIVNLDNESGFGTHWVAYTIKGKDVLYYDSYGDLRPPLELIKYFGKNTCIKYNYERFQNFNTPICGHLCLKFLINNCG